ncbi:hypothetical protein ATO11_04360 [Pseudaestuariivita atlantica]|uniref:Uncharacterized protein n=1 Tax=Pseudaestuariivita atlantica TaxID=1317121 RepID=A0A0L1JSC4_9RHOB|nr:hypothetical protein ATO11_04360 [Pseudaestuariivita atlantica]
MGTRKRDCPPVQPFGTFNKQRFAYGARGSNFGGLVRLRLVYLRGFRLGHLWRFGLVRLRGSLWIGFRNNRRSGSFWRRFARCNLVFDAHQRGFPSV